jgi:hypothetical protein
MNCIEKAARLIGIEGEMFLAGGGFLIAGKTVQTCGIFNPYTNKADLMDVECELGIDIEWFDTVVMAYKYGTGINVREILAEHHDRFTARAHAVMAVVEQIYDKQFGGE